MTQIYKIMCELTIPVVDILRPKEMMDEFFTVMLQRMVKNRDNN